MNTVDIRMVLTLTFCARPFCITIQNLGPFTWPGRKQFKHTLRHINAADFSLADIIQCEEAQVPWQSWHCVWTVVANVVVMWGLYVSYLDGGCCGI